MGIRLFSPLLLSACMAALFSVCGQRPDSAVRLISGSKFELSQAAMDAEIYGNVMLALTVDKDGSPKNSILLAGPAWPCGSNPKKELSSLEDAIKANLMSSKYAPAIKNGVPVESRISLNFMIGEEYRQKLKERADAESLRQGKAPAALISGGVINGRAISLARPEYPFAAKSEGISGTVLVAVLIDETGAVIRAGAVSGPRALQNSSRDAACKAKFSPTLLKNIPVKVSAQLTYNFFAP